MLDYFLAKIQLNSSKVGFYWNSSEHARWWSSAQLLVSGWIWFSVMNLLGLLKTSKQKLAKIHRSARHRVERGCQGAQTRSFFGFIFSAQKVSQLSDRWSLPSSVSLGIGRFVMIPKDRSSQDLHSPRENCEFAAELCANPEKTGGKDRKNTGLSVTHVRWWNALSGQPAFVTSMPLVLLPYRIAWAGHSRKGHERAGPNLVCDLNKCTSLLSLSTFHCSSNQSLLI